MSEESADEPAPSPAPLPERRWRRVRKVWLLALGLVTVLVVVVLAVSLGGGARSGGADPLVTPEQTRISGVTSPPSLPGDPNTQLIGVVVDGTNMPVASVSIELRPEAVMSRPAPSPTAGSAHDAGSGAAADPRVETTSSDGRFAFIGLAPGRYRLRVTGPDLLPAELRFVPVPSDETRIVVARKVRIEGSVFDGSTFVPDVTVGLRGEAIGGLIETKTDAQGGFRFEELPEGRYQVYAYREALAARAVRINRLGAGPFPPVELALEAATIVVGRVIDRDEGTGLPAAVELRPASGDDVPRYARTERDGAFRIEGIPNGRWIADAFSPGYLSEGGIELDAGRGIPELALTAGATVEGRVFDASGRPIANAAVRALAQSPTMHEHSAAVDHDRLRRFSGLIAAPIAMSQVPGSAADPLLLPRGELGVMVGPIPPIPPPGAYVARPTMVDPSTVPGRLSEPAPLAIDPARASRWVTGSDGRYRIRGLPRGKVTVLAVAGRLAEGVSRPVTLRAGQTITNVDIVLGPGTVLVGRVTDQHGAGVAGAQLHAQPAVGTPMDAFSDDTGHYRLGPLTGSVHVIASAYGHADVARTLRLEIGAGDQALELREDWVLTVADAVLSGTLDDVAGVPVKGARIEIVNGSGKGRQTVVAGDGTFSIDRLPAGSLRVRVTHPDYPATELDARAERLDRAKVRLRLPLGGAVEGIVLDTGGSGLAGLLITGDGPGDAIAETTTDQAGRWRLGPIVTGAWKLTIAQPGFVPVTRDVTVTTSRVPGATSVYDVRIDLTRGALVGGTVRDARGQRVAGATITVQAATGDGPSATGTTDSYGEFRVRDAPTGTVEVVATYRDASGSQQVTLRAADEVLGLAIEVK